MAYIFRDANAAEDFIRQEGGDFGSFMGYQALVFSHRVLTSSECATYGCIPS